MAHHDRIEAVIRIFLIELTHIPVNIMSVPDLIYITRSNVGFMAGFQQTERL